PHCAASSSVAVNAADCTPMLPLDGPAGVAVDGAGSWTTSRPRCVPVVSDTPVPVTKTDTFGAYAGVGITRLLPKAVQLEPLSVEYQAAKVVLPLAVERTSLIRTVLPTPRTELPKSP